MTVSKRRSKAFAIVCLVVTTLGCSETTDEGPVAGVYTGGDVVGDERFRIGATHDGDRLQGTGINGVGDWEVYTTSGFQWVSVRRIVSFSGTIDGDFVSTQGEVDGEHLTATLRDDEGTDYTIEGQFRHDISSTVWVSGGVYDSTVFRATFVTD